MAAVRQIWSHFSFFTYKDMVKTLDFAFDLEVVRRSFENVPIHMRISAHRLLDSKRLSVLFSKRFVHTKLML